MSLIVRVLGSGLLWLRDASWWGLVEEHVFVLDVLALVLASSPTVPPVANQKLETEGVDLHARLETDTEIPKIHLVLVGMCEKETEMAGDGEKKVVIEWREV